MSPWTISFLVNLPASPDTHVVRTPLEARLNHYQ